MKVVAAFIMLFALMFGMSQPATTFAKSGNSGSGSHQSSSFDDEEDDDEDDDDDDDDDDNRGRGGHDDDEDDDDDSNDDNCTTTSTSSALEVEADVFTDTTIVKVEKGGVKTVFETDATTLSGVVDVVANRFSLTASEVEAVLDFEIEDRASRSTDFDASSSSGLCTNGNSDDDDDDSIDDSRDDSREAKLMQLQELLLRLIELLRLQLGLSL